MWWPFNRKQKKALTNYSMFGDYAPRSWRNLNPDDKAVLQYFTGTVYAAAQRHSDRIAGTTLRLYSKRATSNKLKALEAKSLLHRTQAKYITTSTNIGEVTRHDALTLLHRPNPYMTGRQFRKYSELYNVITGVSYSEIKWMESTPIQLWLLPPHCVKVEADAKTGLPISFTYGGEKLNPDDVLVETAENLCNPYAGTSGQSPVRSIIDKLQLHDYITEKLVAIMSAPKFSGILSPRGEDAMLTDEQRQRWESKLQQYRRDKQGDLIFLDGDVRFDSVQTIATDLAAVEIIKQIEEQIARVFQMPLMILRGSEGTSRASYEAAVQEWMDGGISSRLREIEDVLNFTFLPKFDDAEDLFFAFDDPSPLNERQDYELYTLGCGGPFLTVNEARQETGWEPREGGDTIRETNGVVLGDVPELTETEAAPEPLVETEQELNTNPALTLNGAQISSAVSIVQQVAQGLLPRDAAIGMLQTLVNLTPEQAEACMGTVGVSFFAGQGETPPQDNEDDGKTKALKLTPPTGKKLEPLVKIIRKHFATWRVSAMGAIDKAAHTIETKTMDGEIHIKGLPSRFIPSEKWAKDLAEDSQPVVEIFLKDRGHKLLQRVGASPDVLNVFNGEVSKFAKRASLDFAQSTLDTTTKEINKALDETRDAIGEGLEAGETIQRLSQRVNDIFENMDSNRATLIAQTEASRAYHEGLRMSAEQSGVVKGLKHLTTSDPCPICEDLNGKVYGLNDPLPPENTHPNCLCALEEVLDDSLLNESDD